ncbi:unnamed protein product [Tetraodon nigroviridis]|uniref:(spotted green pufferfish) hypothetical protein n=1 Tax=Tetraodon nigroviridis TaxID=99883 RepID=Q4SF39_TETNG|nr:unnamed protein product [Tetraodon nigroviridis]
MPASGSANKADFLFSSSFAGIGCTLKGRETAQLKRPGSPQGARLKRPGSPEGARLKRTPTLEDRRDQISQQQNQLTSAATEVFESSLLPECHGFLREAPSEAVTSDEGGLNRKCRAEPGHHC